MKELSKLTVFFICETFTGYEDFFKGKTRSPAGLPAAYQTWRGYAARSHKVHVFTQDYNYDEYSDRGTDNLLVHNIPVPFKYLRKKRYSRLGKFLFRISRFIGLWRVFRRANCIARFERPDVVYSFSPWSTIPAIFVARKHDAVHVIRRFGTTLYNVINGTASMWKNDSVIVEVLAYRLYYNLIIMGNDGTFGDKVSLHYKCPPSKLAFWTNGIDKNMYDPNFDRRCFRRKYNISEESPVILSVSRLVGWKRIDRVIDLMQQVKTQRPDARLVIVGTGYDEQRLKEYAVKCGVADVTFFAGSVPHSKIKDFFNASDIYVQFFDLTNRCNPLFEAMCCGLPVITFEGPGTSDLVIHGETALCVKSNLILQEAPVECVEAEEMKKAAEYVVLLMNDEQLRHRLGQNARTLVTEKLQTWEERIDMEIEKVGKLVCQKKAQGKVIASQNA